MNIGGYKSLRNLANYVHTECEGLKERMAILRDELTQIGDAFGSSAFKDYVGLIEAVRKAALSCGIAETKIIALEKKHAASGLAIVGLNSERVSPARAPQVVRDYMKAHGIEYPCAIIDRGLLRTIPDFRGFPTMLLVDRQGRVRLKKVGYTAGEVLEAAIEKLLAEEGPAPDAHPESKGGDSDDGVLF